MRPECKKYTGRMLQICNGCADLPPYKINAYRDKWGLAPLRDEEITYSPPEQRIRTQETETTTPRSFRRITKRGLSPQGKGSSTHSVKSGCSGCGSPKRVAKPSTLTKTGPGSKLLGLLEGMPHCDACLALAGQMDQWGKAGCAEHFDEIVSDILPRAQVWAETNHSWAHKILSITSSERSVLRLGIAATVKLAITLARD